MAKDYKKHICGECRNYVPRHSAVIPELLIGQMNEGSCKPYKNGPAACMCQREMVACSNFRKRKKSPTGKRMCVCRECQYNNPTPDGHFCALLKEYHSQFGRNHRVFVNFLRQFANKLDYSLGHVVF